MQPLSSALEALIALAGLASVLLFSTRRCILERFMCRCMRRQTCTILLRQLMAFDPLGVGLVLARNDSKQAALMG